MSHALIKEELNQTLCYVWREKNPQLKIFISLLFQGKKSWNLQCKFKYGFSIALCQKQYFWCQGKKVFWDLDITFALYNILKLRAYLFGLLDKDPCDSTDLKTEQLFVLYPWMTWTMISRILCNSKIYSVAYIKGHLFMASTKNDQFFLLLPPWSAKMNNRSIVQKQYNLQTLDKNTFQESLTHLLWSF